MIIIGLIGEIIILGLIIFGLYMAFMMGVMLVMLISAPFILIGNAIRERIESK